MRKVALILLLSLSVHAISNEQACTVHRDLACGEGVTFHKLGILDGGLSVYSYTYIFGQALRASNRVVFLDQHQKFVGMYSVPEPPNNVQGDCVVFSGPSGLNSSICISSGGLPAPLLLDGEIIDLHIQTINKRL